MNNITVNNYIETVVNPKGRFKTLNIIPKLDEDGNPVLYTKNGIVVFTVSIDGVGYRLKCFTSSNTIGYRRAKLIAQYTDIKRYKNLVIYQYLYREMLVFNAADEYDYVDVVLEEIPKGEELIDVVYRLARKRDYRSAEVVLKNIVTMFKWLYEFGVTHNSITPQSIIIDNNLNPILINYDLVTKNRSSRDFQAMATLGVTLFASMCAEKEISSKDNICRNYKEVSRKVVSLVARAELESELDQLKEIASAIVDSNDNMKNWSYIESMLSLLSTKLGEYRSLEIALNSHNISCLEPKSEMCKNYDFVGILSDNMIRVESGGKWQYLDCKGSVAISTSFDMAYDFVESRASVSIDGKWGLIDQNGEFVASPIYDDLTWDGDSNVAIVSIGGLVGLINRSGVEVAPLKYDLICSGSDGRMLAMAEYYYGYLSSNGSVAIEFKYDTASSFRSGIASVEIGEDRFLIDTSGDKI